MYNYRYNYRFLSGGDVLLVTPPPIPPVAPLAATAYLAAKIRSLGVRVEILDLGLDAQKWFTEPEHLAERISLYPKPKVSVFTKNKFPMGEVSIGEIKDGIISARETLRQKYVDRSAYRRACLIYGGAFHLYDNVSGSNRISPPGSYLSVWRNQPLSFIMDHLLGSDDVHRDFIEAASSEILKHDYKVIGFSILHGEQWLAAWGVAKALKQKGFPGKIVFGGVQVSFFIEHIKKEPEFFRYVDWYSPRRGDVFCEDLNPYCEGSLDESRLRNIYYISKNREIRYTGGYQEYGINTMTPPDYSGLLLEDYLVPEISLPIQSITKCYWGKCTFCMVTGDLLVDRPSIASGEQIFEQMMVLYKKFNCRNFFFVDDSTSPQTLNGTVKLIIENKMPFFWQVKGIIPEKSISTEVLHEWYKGGCRALSLGFETASRRLLKKLDKKYALEDLERILLDCHKLHITTYCSGFYGHPEETKEDIIETLDFIKKYDTIATLFLLYPWSLNPHSFDFLNSEKLGISRFEEDEFRTYGKRLANIRWDSPERKTMKQIWMDLSLQNERPLRPRNYFWSDWIYFGHSIHIPYSWTASGGEGDD